MDIKDLNPLVSIVLSVYNDEMYIRKAIESIIMQTYSNLEIIIINDGSNSSTIKILEEFKEKDNRIRLIHQVNKGLAYSLNRGIELANGIYIARMDSDDISLKNRISKQINFLQNNKDIIALGSNADAIDKDGEYVYKINKPSTWDEIKTTLPYKSPFIHPSVIFKRKEAIDVGGYPNIPIGQDLFFFINLSKKGKFLNLDESLIKYRISPHALSRKNNEQKQIYNRILDEYIITNDLNKRLLYKLEYSNSNQNQKSKNYEYHLLLSKKYLWNNYNKKLSRKNSKFALNYAEGKEYLIPTILYLLPVLGKKCIKLLHRFFSKESRI